MRWLTRVFWPFGRRGDWPGGTPPTVSGGGAVVFHCPECKTPLAAKATTCPSCARPVTKS